MVRKKSLKSTKDISFLPFITERKIMNMKLNYKCNENIIIEKDGLTATNSIGYRTVIADTGSSGSIYFEVNVIKSVGIRIGFITSEGELNGPVGADNKGYSYGNVNGYKFHNSVRERYGITYKENDIIGALLLRGKEYSFIKFFKNGTDLGMAFYNIPDDIFYPAVSLYDGSIVNLNFGPYLAYPYSWYIVIIFIKL